MRVEGIVENSLSQYKKWWFDSFLNRQPHCIFINKFVIQSLICDFKIYYYFCTNNEYALQFDISWIARCQSINALKFLRVSQKRNSIKRERNHAKSRRFAYFCTYCIYKKHCSKAEFNHYKFCLIAPLMMKNMLFSIIV